MNRLPNALSLPGLKHGYKTLIDNTKYNIQYNHIEEYCEKEGIDLGRIVKTFDYKRILNLAVRENRDIREVLEDFVNATKSMNSFLLQYRNSLPTTVSDDGIDLPTSMSAVRFRFGGTFYELNNEKDFKKLIERLSEASYMCENFGKLICPRHGYIVPKNSDKASDEVRQFVCKPVLNEVNIAAIIHSNAQTINDWQKFSVSNHVHTFGPRILPNGQFVPYIYEYNLMNNKVAELKGKYNSVIVTDVKKYFNSIDNKHLIALFTEILGNYKEAYFLLNQLNFTYINQRNNVVDFNKGLTIESNYQHVIANLLMQKMLTHFMNTNGKLFQNVDEINFVTYIDDIFIFIKHRDYFDDVEKSKKFDKEVLTELELFLSTVYGLELNKQKTKFTGYHTGYTTTSTAGKPISSTKRMPNIDGIKTLVKLPTFNYFENLELAVGDDKDIFSSQNGLKWEAKISTWLFLLEEIVYLFEDYHYSADHFQKAFTKLTGKTKELIYNIVLSPGSNFYGGITSRNLWYHTDLFIGRYVFTRLNQLAFKLKTPVPELLTPLDVSRSYRTGLVRKYTLDRYTSYDDYIRNSIKRIKHTLHADNVGFYIENYRMLKFDISLVQNLGKTDFWNKQGIYTDNSKLKNSFVVSNYDNELTILGGLQYLYLCRPEMLNDYNTIVDTCVNLVKKFPNKSRFIAGVIKKHTIRMIKLGKLDSEEATQYLEDILATDTDLESVKFDYFAYCIRKMYSRIK